MEKKILKYKPIHERDPKYQERISTSLVRRLQNRSTKLGTIYTHGVLKSVDVKMNDNGTGTVKRIYEIIDNFTILEDGLLKCNKCYTYMIPFVNDDGHLIFYNLEDGFPHLKVWQKKYSFDKLSKKRRKGYTKIRCNIPKTKTITKREHKIGHFKPKYDEGVFSIE